MTEKELLDWCEEQVKSRPYMHFPEELFKAIPKEITEKVVNKYGSKSLMRLPEREIKFFNWLKKEDPDIWYDLWNEEEEEPYLVGVSFLPIFSDITRGFPICDLEHSDNYYFALSHFVEKESTIFLDSVKKRFLDKKELSISQMLALEITIAPIDIWRFAYRHKYNLIEAKAAVEILVEDGILVHLTEAEHLANFVEL